MKRYRRAYRPFRLSNRRVYTRRHLFDGKVANDLGVPRAWVTGIRDEMFGPEGSNEQIRATIAEATAVLEEIKALAKTIEPPVTLRYVTHPFPTRGEPMPYPENSETETVLTVSHLLATMRNGAANDRATEEMEKLIAAIQAADDEKASGYVNLKIKVSKLKGGDTELKVDMKVTSSIPVAAIPFGIYYPGENGSLHRTDPRQMSLLDNRRDDRGDQDERLSRIGRGPTVVEGQAVRHG